ncbi:MAG: hypothetical protein IKV10_04225 [Alphaproteobacteria bacterium]|nr:hypothetical protein [Alphaproteobacteria bacterium]MBR4860480.1 hypothetical protein [Alphaproteobacteria bacterium]
MYKFIVMILSVFILAGCGAKSPTQSIVESGVAQIERSQAIIKNTETLAQCKDNADSSLQTAKESLINAGESCKTEVSNLENDLIRWKSYFGILVFGIGVLVYLYLVRRLSKNVI